MKKGLILFSSILFIILVAALIYVATGFSSAKFVISNNTNDKVSVIAKWRNNERPLGILLAGEKTELKVKDEASIEIAATFTNGSSISSIPVYFTSGMVYNFEIYNNKIDSSFE